MRLDAPAAEAALGRLAEQAGMAGEPRPSASTPW